MSTTLTVSDQLLSTTLFSHMKTMKSQINKPVPFLEDLEKLGMEEEEGGERMIIPMAFNRHSRTTQLSTGYEPINLTVKPIGNPGYDGWCDVIRPIVIAGKDNRVNRGKAKIISIMETRSQDAYDGLRMEMQQQLIQGGQAGWSDCNNLNGTDNTTGFLESAAYGSQTNVVHNLSKATYNFSVGWQNQWTDLANSFSTNGLQGMYDMMTRVFALSKGAKLRWYASIKATNNLKRALNSNERYLSESELDGGKRVMTFGGAPVSTLFSDMPNAGTNTTATPWSFMLVDFDELKFVKQKGFYFEAGEFETQSGYDVQASFIHTMGQLRVTYLANFGLATKGEVW